MIALDDTIAAIATARGPAWRGILRLSGRDARSILARFFQPIAHDQAAELPSAAAGHLKLTHLHATVPATVFLSRAPRSYTGEDMVEVHTIGAAPIIELALADFISAGARQAMPGEFTMRAFLNRKLDLTAAEAIAGLIDATDRAQADTALQQLAGGIAQPILALRNRLLDLLADLEAGLDFTEDDIDFIDRTALLETLHQAARMLADLTRQLDRRTVSAEQYRIVLAGSPNAGKSSLFNALVGQPAALVSSQAGTTRDYLVAPWMLPHRAGTVELVDTAGIEQALDPIRLLSQAARDQAVARADMIIWCVDRSVAQAPDGTRPPPVPGREANGSERIRQAEGSEGSTDHAASGSTKQWEAELEVACCAERPGHLGLPLLMVWTKCDLVPSERIAGANAEPSTPASQIFHRIGHVAVSARTGFGLAELARRVADWVLGQAAGQSMVGLTAARCRHTLAAAARAVEAAIERCRDRASDELIAVEIRLAIDELGQVVGAVYTDDLLDRVFSRFCIGK